jgi:hypothetical protein
MNADDTSYEVLASALGLLTATHADSRMAGRVTMDYLSGVPADRSQMLDLVAGMTAMAAMLIKMRAEETGMAPEETLAELGRRGSGIVVGFRLDLRIQTPAMGADEHERPHGATARWNLGVRPIIGEAN